MKYIMFLTLVFSSFLAVACPEDQDSIGYPVNDGNDRLQTNSGLSARSSGIVGTDCILELPPIQAVITYITFAPNWLGGSVGIAFALNYAGTGGGIGVISGLSWSTLSGCDSTAQAERQKDARNIYYGMKRKMERRFVTAVNPSPEYTTAKRWLQVNSDGNLFKVNYPDLSKGFFRIDEINPIGFEQESCG